MAQKREKIIHKTKTNEREKKGTRNIMKDLFQSYESNMSGSKAGLVARERSTVLR